MSDSDNLFFTLAAGFADQPERCCLACPGGADWSFSELDTLSGRMASALLEQAAPGDRVLVQIQKSPEAVALYLACLRAGLVLVPLNTAYTASELAYFREDAQPALEIDDAGLRQLCLDACHYETAPTAAVAPADIAAIVYTSGTTGKPKGAMLSHTNLASNACTLHREWGFRRDDVLLHALPIFHVHGLFVALNTALMNGSRIVFLESFDLQQVLQALPHCTLMMGVPTFYSRLLDCDSFGAAHCENMRLFISGSAPLTEKLFHAFEARSGHRILERYGMSETGMITSNPLQGERVAGSVGFALPGISVRVCGHDGSTLPAGQTGMVEVSGPNVFCGYWRNPEKTRSEFREDGYFVTGDLGKLDTDGRLTLVGREKDLIISGGLNVYPSEVEQCLDSLPGVDESAVIGVPHPDLGEAVVAVLVTDSGEMDTASLKSALLDRLAGFKHPKAFIQQAALPRNTMGKVQKQTLRERYRDWFSTLPAA
ncbi:MAG: AMP-binding protein [Halieaceae bacterium]|jgi:malonyl-CoA/methylmalonyl-CoA synthetase|nr:AMP-binding protein [Halieaceae bacterium]